MPRTFKAQRKGESKPAVSTPEVCSNILELAQQVNITPDPRQSELLLSNSKRVILNCSRQWGKSTCAAIKALHVLTNQSEALVLIVSYTARQSAELLKKIELFTYKIGWDVARDKAVTHSLILPNRSRLLALPGAEKSIRGYSAVDLLIVDEAAAVPDDLYQAARPMLAVSDGTLWLLSTARGKQGFFYDTWRGPAGACEASNDDWFRIKVTAEECPRIPQRFVEEERRAKTRLEYEQEYEGNFSESRYRTFKEEWLENLFDDNVPLLEVPDFPDLE